MNPKQFLLIGGGGLVLLGVLGFVGILGPTSEQSIFGEAWWFDSAENWAHLVLGVIGIAAAFVLPVMWRKYLTLLLGLVGVLVGLYSLLVSETLLGANLENPADTILHIVVGAWALLAGMRKEAVAVPPPIMGGSMSM